MIPVSLRILAALHAGAQLVHRPRGVVHLYAGPLTPSGRFAAAAGRTVCRARTRRLAVLDRPGGTVELGGRRFCRRCTAALPPVLGAVVQHPVSRDDWQAAYGALTLDDFETALAWSGCGRAASLEDWAAAAAGTHTLGYLLSVVHGPQPFRRPTDAHGARLYDLHAAIVTARHRFAANARTPEEREANRRQAEDLAAQTRLALRAHRRADAVARAQDRRGYRTPYERQLLASTG